MELSRTRDRLRPRDRGPAWPREGPRRVKKKDRSSYRPTGRLEPAPAARASGSLALAALEYRARRGESIVLDEDETRLGRFALPRAGWWRTAQRARLRTRPRSPSQIKRDEGLKRHPWWQYRAWSRITSGVLLNVMGALQYGTSKVFSTIVPHCDAQEWRPYLHQVLATLGTTDTEVVMVVERSGIHRAHKLDATLDHYQGQLRLHCLPAHCGHHRHPIEGFWRVMKDAIGAGRCCADLHLLYQRTRQVLMAHQERPIDAFRW
jgi:DDE superfamily endonuclease